MPDHCLLEVFHGGCVRSIDYIWHWVLYIVSTLFQFIAVVCSVQDGRNATSAAKRCREQSDVIVLKLPNGTIEDHNLWAGGDGASVRATSGRIEMRNKLTFDQ
jgi:hypothetical protein